MTATDTAPFLREYLDVHVKFMRERSPTTKLHYLGPYDLVAREGTEYAPSPYDPERWGGFKGIEKHCFENALFLAEKFPRELTYVEGYASKTMPTGHAWCITRDGELVDPTWDPAGEEYLGIPFDTAFVIERTDKRGYYGVIDDWQNDFPLCREPFDHTIYGPQEET